MDSEIDRQTMHQKYNLLTANACNFINMFILSKVGADYILGVI